MTEGLVSVIMPAYNASGTVRQAMESVFIQTGVDWELIVIDDGSTDGTDETVRQACSDHSLLLIEADQRDDDSENIIRKDPESEDEYVESTNRVILIRKTNSGVADTRNVGIENAKGQYIAFLDSDDLWYEGKLKQQIKLLRETNAVMSYGSCDVINANGEHTGIVRHVPKRLTFNKALYGNRMPCSTVVVDRSRLTKDLRFPKIGHEDYALWLSILRGDHSDGPPQEAVGIRDIVAAYRQTEGSLSGDKKKAARWTYSIYKDYLQLPLFKRLACFVGYSVRAVVKRI